MDPVRVGLAVQGGVSVVWTCERYWEGRDRGLLEPQCVTQRPCTSPLGGMAFPEYVGPISDFTRWCFVCGATATRALAAKGNPRRVGVCDEHATLKDRVQGARLDGNPVPPDILDMLGPKPKKTLGQVIAETEKKWQADEDPDRRL